MENESTYSHVIYRKKLDPPESELVNSFRYPQIVSKLKKKKTWNSDIKSNELQRLKRKREEKYLKSCSPECRPVLVIRRKELFKDIECGKGPSEPATYLKKDMPAERIKDFKRQIDESEIIGRRETIIHPISNKSLSAPLCKNVYKLEGSELLPEGYLELEPLPLQDEYNFVDLSSKQLFHKTQERAKRKRRKQYAERTTARQREVVIYASEDYADPLIAILDEWLANEGRAMTQKEICQIAQEQNVSVDDLTKLQNLFLKEKGLLHNGKKNLPNYKDVTARLMNGTQSSYQPIYLPSLKKNLAKAVCSRFGISYKTSKDTNDKKKYLISKELFQVDNKIKTKENKTNSKLLKTCPIPSTSIDFSRSRIPIKPTDLSFNSNTSLNDTKTSVPEIIFKEDHTPSINYENINKNEYTKGM